MPAEALKIDSGSEMESHGHDRVFLIENDRNRNGRPSYLCGLTRFVEIAECQDLVRADKNFRCSEWLVAEGEWFAEKRLVHGEMKSQPSDRGRAFRFKRANFRDQCIREWFARVEIGPIRLVDRR